MSGCDQWIINKCQVVSGRRHHKFARILTHPNINNMHTATVMSAYVMMRPVDYNQVSGCVRTTRSNAELDGHNVRNTHP